MTIRKLGGGEPTFGCNYHLRHGRIKPSPPPTERAIGDNVVVAGRHNMQIIIWRGCGAGDKTKRLPKRQILVRPFDVVRKHYDTEALTDTLGQ